MDTTLDGFFGRVNLRPLLRQEVEQLGAIDSPRELDACGLGIHRRGELLAQAVSHNGLI